MLDKLLKGIPVPPRVRVGIGWLIFLGALVMWPVSMLTFAKGEPPTVVSLSWAAIVLEALNVLTTQELAGKSQA